MKVVDISDWQEGINFDDLVAAGVKGVIIKALNGTNPTNCVYDFIAECRQRGLPWGVYCYTHAWTPDDARSEAQAMLNLLGGETPSLGKRRLSAFGTISKTTRKACRLQLIG